MKPFIVKMTKNVDRHELQKLPFQTAQGELRHATITVDQQKRSFIRRQVCRTAEVDSRRFSLHNRSAKKPDKKTT